MAHAVASDETVPYEYKGHVVSNPRAELAVNNAKYIRNCTELHMARRNIEFLWGFQRFVNLEVLWLNDNKLQALDNLDTNFRLKQVYAHNNQIRSLQDTVQHCKFLDTLVVSNNRITDLKSTVDDLECFQYLHNLELLGNPLAEEPNYRLYVIHKLPSLHVFDRHVVTPEERTRATKKFGRRKGSGTKKRGGKTGGADAGMGAPGDIPKQPLSALEGDLAREVRQIKAEMEAKERAELQAAYSAGARTTNTGPVMLKSAAMTMSRAMLADAAAADEAKSKGGAADDGADDWDVVRVTAMFKTFDANASGTISREEFRRALDHTEDMGMTLTIGKDSAIMDRYFRAMDKDGDDNVVIKEFVAAMTGELEDEEGPLPPFPFSKLLPDQALIKSEHMYAKAADVQKQLLPMPADDPRRPALEKKAFELAQKAARLADIHSTAKRKEVAEARARIAGARGGGTGGAGSGAGAGGGGGRGVAMSGGKTRKDYITFKSTVRIRGSREKNAAVTAVDSGSDSDTDSDDGKGVGAAFAHMRAKRRAAKPRRVINSSLDI